MQLKKKYIFTKIVLKTFRLYSQQNIIVFVLAQMRQLSLSVVWLESIDSSGKALFTRNKLARFCLLSRGQSGASCASCQAQEKASNGASRLGTSLSLAAFTPLAIFLVLCPLIKSLFIDDLVFGLWKRRFNSGLIFVAKRDGLETLLLISSQGYPNILLGFPNVSLFSQQREVM